MSHSYSASASSQSPQSSQTETKLSQWEALTLESLRSKGWSNEQIIERVTSGELPSDDSKFQFDYSILTTLAKEQADLFIRAVTEGYGIKYNTIRGIHSWILVAYGHEGHLSLEHGEEAVYAALHQQEAERLRSVLSFGWQLNLAPLELKPQLEQLLAEQQLGEVAEHGKLSSKAIIDKDLYVVKPIQVG